MAVTAARCSVVNIVLITAREGAYYAAYLPSHGSFPPVMDRVKMERPVSSDSRPRCRGSQPAVSRFQAVHLNIKRVSDLAMKRWPQFLRSETILRFLSASIDSIEGVRCPGMNLDASNERGDAASSGMRDRDERTAWVEEERRERRRW